MVGLIASRITLRAIGGATRLQQLLLVEIPSAKTQIMVGVNQCLMAALSMVIIAAVIGGFDDIGWEVLLTMRKAQFGQSLLAGLVIVAFAIIIDRMSGHLARARPARPARRARDDRGRDAGHRRLADRSRCRVGRCAAATAGRRRGPRPRRVHVQPRRRA
ncbi:MAG: hypothetical protein RI571_07110 [Roseovarius sp.]|nr:hypothetical protein [Roseovarius sp.]